MLQDMLVIKCSALRCFTLLCSASKLAWFLLVLLWSYAHLISNNIRNCLQCYEMHLFYIFKEIVYADILPKRHWFIEQLFRFMCSTFFFFNLCCCSSFSCIYVQCWMFSGVHCSLLLNSQFYYIIKRDEEFFIIEIENMCK